jgi:heat shock protein HtpX
MGIYEQISSNKRKSVLLIFLFLIFIILIGLAIGVVYGNSYFGVGLAIVIGTIYFLISYYRGDAMILTMSKAKPADKKQYPHLVNTVEGIAIAAGVPTPKTYVIDDDALNAFATGRDPQHASITVTTGLLNKMKRLELEGVIAHEMSHVKNYDIRVMMLAAVMVGLSILLSDFLLSSFIWRAGGRRREGNQLTIILIIVAIALAILSPFIGEAIKLAISRKREFLADADAALLTRYPKGLADALRRIKSDPDPLVDYANKATAHLFISTPFRKKKGAMARLYATHPPIDERIKALDSM